MPKIYSPELVFKLFFFFWCMYLHMDVFDIEVLYIVPKTKMK